MKTALRPLSIILATAIAAAASLTLATSASAASNFDVVINPIDSLIITDSEGSNPCVTDLSVSWANEFRSFLDPEMLASFDSRKAWSVSVLHHSEDNYAPSAVRINWWEDKDLPDTAIFVENSVSAGLKVDATHYGTMSIGFNANTGECFLNGWAYQGPVSSGIAHYYIPAKQHELRPFLVYGIDIAYPDGYEGVRLPLSYTPPTPKYVAMGDSFSSGEGAGDFEPDSDKDGVNECHRSRNAYPRLLQNDLSLNLGQADFVACSGATTNNVLHGGPGTGAWNEPAQVTALTPETEVVTISIGGNDVGFKDFATQCTVQSCDFNTGAYRKIEKKINKTLSRKLTRVYESIDAATPDTAKIYVVGYPQIVPAPINMPTGHSSSCWPFNGGTDERDPMKGDAAAAYNVVALLNKTIESAVAGYGSSKFMFVDPNEADSPFIGHDWCQQDKYFADIGYPAVGNMEYSFHPNQQGHEAYATILKKVM